MDEKYSDTIGILASKEMSDVAQNVFIALREKYKDERFSYNSIPRKIFSGGELYPNLGEIRIKNRKIFLFHSLRYPDPNTSLIELYLTINALTLATVESITLVLPYLSYFRQDRKDKPRVPISARAIAELLQIHKKVERLITMDMHSDQGQGFFNIPVDNLFGSILHSQYFEKLFNSNFDNVITVAPDHGAAIRTRRFAKYCKPDMPCFPLDKRRNESGIEIIQFNGEVSGKIVLLYDDEIASGDTSITAGKEILRRGAKEVYVVATHWIACTKNGIATEDKFKESNLKVIVTNTIPRSRDYLEIHKDWLTMIPIDDLLAHVIYESSLVGGSISSIFNKN